MRTRRVRGIDPALAAVATAGALLLLAADAATAAQALFRAKQYWWFGSQDVWTNGHVVPPDGTGMNPTSPPAVLNVGDTPAVRGFTAPKSFIKNTQTFETPCYIGYPCSKGQYSYWNAKGGFRPQNPNAPEATTTLRFETTMSNPSGPPTAMGDPVTPTTTWGGRYDHSRGGSIMIWPGKNRFGGTMRFFSGPNSHLERVVSGWPTYPYYYTESFRAIPLSMQLGTGVEFAIGEVTESAIGIKFRLTEMGDHRLVTGTTSMGGPQYYARVAHYLATQAPYTTGMVQVWEPNGNTNTLQTATGYDNRTAAGLNGTISLVRPRLVHSYVVFPPSSGEPIRMAWSVARTQRIDFRFLPEPAGIAWLVPGVVALAGLFRLRRCCRHRTITRGFLA